MEDWPWKIRIGRSGSESYFWKVALGRLVLEGWAWPWKVRLGRSGVGKLALEDSALGDSALERSPLG